MPLYVALVSYTDRGMQAVRESPRRLSAAKTQLGEMGGRFQAVYMTMGAYDLVLVYEAPDDAIAARFTLGLGQCFAFSPVRVEHCLHGKVENEAYAGGRSQHPKIFHRLNPIPVSAAGRGSSRGSLSG